MSGTCNERLENFIFFLREQSDILYNFLTGVIEDQYGVELDIEDEDLEKNIIITLKETGHSGAHTSTGIGDDLPYEQERMTNMVDDIENIDENDRDNLKEKIKSTTHQTHLHSLLGSKDYKKLGSLLLYLDSVVVYRRLQEIYDKRANVLQLLDDSCRDPTYYYSFGFIGEPDTKFTILDFERLITLGYIILEKEILNEENTSKLSQLLDKMKKNYNNELKELHDISGIIGYIQNKNSLGKESVYKFIKNLKARTSKPNYWKDDEHEKYIIYMPKLVSIPQGKSILKESIVPSADNKHHSLKQFTNTPRYWVGDKLSHKRRKLSSSPLGGKKNNKSKRKLHRRRHSQKRKRSHRRRK